MVLLLSLVLELYLHNLELLLRRSGAMLFDLREWIARIGGFIVFIFGFCTLGIITIPFLNYDTRRQAQLKNGSYLSSGLMGILFGWVDSQCWRGVRRDLHISIECCRDHPGCDTAGCLLGGISHSISVG